MKKFFLALIVFIAALVGGCADVESENSAPVRVESKVVDFSDTYNANDTWLVQVYLCGSDLESGGGFATNDLQEMLNVQLPAGVKVLIQTGGSEQWQNNTVNSQAIERFLYSNEGLQRLETLPNADMGNVGTLTEFINYGKNFPADHRIFIFWDHGGGSVSGVCLDERTSNCLSLNDLTKAFGALYTPSAQNPPFEMIGFDACLMATYDTINSLDGFARYVTASEELEPALGWNYTVWLDALANNTAMSGARLGKEICDSYISACKEHDVADTATLSVIDMSKLPELRDAYERFGLEALVKAYQNPKKFFSAFGRGADNAENYGSNNWFQGYTNMVDIVDLARANKDLLSGTADNLIGALDNAVVYKVQGDYRARGGGLSSFYSYDSNTDTLMRYVDLDGAPDPLKLLFYYLLSGELPDEVKPMIEDLAKDPNAFTTPAPVIETPAAPSQQQTLFNVSSMEDFPVQMDAEGNAFVQLNQEQMDLLSSVHCQLVYMGVDDDVIVYLGTDADINADWETGIFTDNFRGVWAMLDGHPVFIEITEENDGYNLYSIPIKLNGVECSVQVAYVYADEKYYILGARKGLDQNGMSSRELIKLRAGDEITTIHYAMTILGDDEDLTQVEVDTFTIGDNPQIKDEPLGDGSYGYMFEFVTPIAGQSALSNVILFTISNGEITTTVDVQ